MPCNRPTMSNRLLPAIVCLLMLTSAAPAVVASGPSDSLIWGISYDWSNMDEDQVTLMGIDPEEVYDELEEAAEYATFSLLVANVLSGSSHFFLEQWDTPGTMTVDDAHGNSHEVTQRNTIMTFRHGSRIDSGMVMYWEDGNENIDIWYSGDSEDLVVLDIEYTEYVDSQLRIVGGDLSMSGGISHESEIQFNFEVNAGGETIGADIGQGLMMSFDMPSITSTWRAEEPTDLYWYTNQDGMSFSGCDDGCGMVSGDYELGIAYDFSLSGVPSEDMGFSADAFDLSLSDSVASQGAFFEEFGTAIFTGERTPSCDGMDYTVDVDMGLSEDIEAQCRTVMPFFSPGMLGMAGVSLGASVEDSSSFEVLIEELQYEIESIFEGESGGSSGNSSGGIFTCDNGEEIPASWENDGEEDCSDGSDENGGGAVMTKLETMIEALDDSDLEKTIETFVEKFIELSEDNQREPLMNLEEGACFTTLWDPMHARGVGIALLVDSQLVVGPDIEGVPEHPVPISISYHVGDDARGLRDAISELDELSDLAPSSEHDPRDVDELLGIEGTEAGEFVVPAPGIIATVALLGVAALASRREK